MVKHSRNRSKEVGQSRSKVAGSIAEQEQRHNGTSIARQPDRVAYLDDGLVPCLEGQKLKVIL